MNIVELINKLSKIYLTEGNLEIKNSDEVKVCVENSQHIVVIKKDSKN